MINQYYPSFTRLPRKGDVVEMTKRGSSTVDALGRVESVDKKKRRAAIRLFARKDYQKK